VVLLAVLIKNTDCISKVIALTEKEELFVGDKVIWWSFDAEIPKNAIGEILSFNDTNTKALVRFDTGGEFELGVNTLKKKGSRTWWWERDRSEAVREERGEEGGGGGGGEKSNNKSSTTTSAGRGSSNSKKKSNFSSSPYEDVDDDEDAPTIRLERRPSWTPKNYEEELGLDVNRGLPARKLSFNEKKRAKAIRSFMEFLGRGQLQRFATKVADLGYLDVRSFVQEVDQSQDIDLCHMLEMNVEEVYIYV
jgi:hypothetical protein